MIAGFDPVFTEKSRVLVLGSFPSVKSREVDFYYGNPRNRFWPLMSKLFQTEIGPDRESKIRFLKESDIALWDIVRSCNIKGSMDADIRDEEIVDLETVLCASKVEAIFFNGKKSFELFGKKYSSLEIRKEVLPSTSPANVLFDEGKWISAFASLGMGKVL